jgi:DNA-binding NarL/FixJ family response regulator
MPRTVAKTRVPAPKRLRPSLGAAVVGEASRRAGIAEVLLREGFGLTGFDDVAALRARKPEREPALFVVWVDDSVSRLSTCVEPVTAEFPQAPVIVVCSSIERWGIREALMAGASGVVLWDDLGVALAPTIRAVLAGQACVPRAHSRQIEPPALSSREKQILGLIVMGYSNGQIAQQLFLAESTVKSHLSSAFGKLGVRSRNEAVHLILDPERGLGMGILAIGGEPMESPPTAAR